METIGKTIRRIVRSQCKILLDFRDLQTPGGVIVLEISSNSTRVILPRCLGLSEYSGSTVSKILRKSINASENLNFRSSRERIACYQFNRLSSSMHVSPVFSEMATVRYTPPLLSLSPGPPMLCIILRPTSAVGV